MEVNRTYKLYNNQSLLKRKNILLEATNILLEAVNYDDSHHVNYWVLEENKIHIQSFDWESFDLNIPGTKRRTDIKILQTQN